MVVGGKEGKLYLVNRDNLGHFSANGDNVVNAVPNGSGQNTPATVIGGLLSTPTYYNGFLYAVPGYSGTATQYAISSTGIISAVSQAPEASFASLGGSPSISSNGTSNGIVWISDRNNSQLIAYDASSLSNELWNSGKAAGGADTLGAPTKFSNPTIANGEVYVGTANSFVVYGLTPPASAPPLAPTLSAVTVSGSSVNLSWTDTTAAPNTASLYYIYESTNGTAGPFNQITTAPAGATSISIGGLSGQTSYTFEIRGFNGFGGSSYSPYSNPASALTGSQNYTVDFTGGFANASNVLQLNGSTAVNSTSLELTDGGGFEAGSAFTKSEVDVSSFNSQFTFNTTANESSADGFTFTIQNSAQRPWGFRARAWVTARALRAQAGAFQIALP